MPYKIRLKHNHHSGTFRRGGHVFGTQPTVVAKLNKALEDELALFEQAKGVLVFEEVNGLQPRELEEGEMLESVDVELRPLEELTVPELRAMAEPLEIPNFNTMRKNELIAAIRLHQGTKVGGFAEVGDEDLDVVIDDDDDEDEEEI